MDGIIQSLAVIFSLSGIAALLIGAVLGIIIGALPGLGPSIGLSLLIPFTYNMSPELSMLLMISLYTSAEYGGSISAILLSTPGTAAAAATAIDGYAMAQKGRANEAISISLTASTVGGILGGLALLLLAMPLAKLALQFGPAGYFAVGLFGLTSVAALSGGSLVKGLLGAVLGLALATVGIDPIAGTPRFTFGQFELYEGVPFLAALIGLFAVSEAIALAEKQARRTKMGESRVGHVFMSVALLKETWRSMVSGSVIGTLLGILPGVGGNIACWVARDYARARDKNPQAYGKGAANGIAAPEASNNATVGGALVPLLSLGVPGSPTTAIMMGALIMHGLHPGPQLFTESPALVYSILFGVIIASLVQYLVGSLFLPIMARTLLLPTGVIAAGILAFAVLGSFAIRNLMFDVWMTLGFGLLGYFMKKLSFPVAPVILAMVLGYLIESNYRTALVSSQGSYMIFLTDPISVLFLILSAVSLAVPIYRLWSARRVVAVDPA
ncbi:tripartite tricarboxylate transporter permease [Aliirhizobium cellulosilyticum]|uniref:Putative tricarboxylic transport membrane protein n=1 Tax=Aliirhizobium cellulosilyticum TaxID=393664 RepID=A0A7W6TK86_9HYPH|nr:tripartite tricarboxylate transporter permease [Rhizobium cellulosilyticum]MBB4351618.1 putative tricarboxylic transport membrane protein [Rhizobium cellulosilyticum]MBB4414870.1 putative tricarboxylic transport membrane protein [Rhizobium cellulosilyticum]MBB4449544.1 putative tricarboxylic transport membrane protein [Rhizobium cellulosilyticum]